MARMLGRTSDLRRCCKQCYPRWRRGAKRLGSQRALERQELARELRDERKP